MSGPVMVMEEDIVDAFLSSERRAMLKSAGISFASGLVAGLSGVLVGHPFDTLKVRMQTGVHGHPLTLFSVYRGVGPPLLTTGIVQAMNFGLFLSFKETLENDGRVHGLPQVFIAAAMAGACISVVTQPSSMLKVQQQVLPRGGMVEQFRAIVVARGMSGLYTGMGPHFLMETIGRGVYMSGFYFFKSVLGPMDEGENPALSFSRKALAGAAAGCLSWIVIYPADVVRNTLQSAVALDPGGKRENAVRCAHRLIKIGGIRRLYRGIHYSFIRAAPVAATILSIWDSVYCFLQEQKI
jgi:solute carrier family 25 carnitine/acylcarnitine transporter 20/29